MSTKTYTRTRVMVIAAASLAIAGTVGVQMAGSRASASSSDPTLGAIPSMAEAATATFPLAGYGISDEALPIIMQAHHVAEQTCMERLGFRGYIPQVYNDPLTASEVSIKANRYRFLAPGMAARNGYHQAGDVAAGGLKSTSVGGAGEVPLSPESQIVETKAYEGIVPSVNGHKVPLGGCKAWSNGRLYRGLPFSIKSTADARMLSAQAQFSAMADGRMLSAAHAWSMCMNKKGWKYATPWEAQGDALRRPDGLFHTSPSAREISAALADVQCRQSTNVFEVWVAVRSAWEKKFLKENLANLERGRVDSSKIVQNARQILAGAI